MEVSLVLIHFVGWEGEGGWVLVAGAYLRLSGRGRGGRLLTFSAFRMGAYSRWVLIQGWALIPINTEHVRLLRHCRV